MVQSKDFLTEMSTLDPASLQHILDLLRGLVSSNQQAIDGFASDEDAARLDKDNKAKILGDLELVLIQSQDAFDQAKGKLDDDQDNVATATTALQLAQQHHDAMIAAKEAGTPPLANEITTINHVIEVLNGLLGGEDSCAAFKELSGGGCRDATSISGSGQAPAYQVLKNTEAECRTYVQSKASLGAVGASYGTSTKYCNVYVARLAGETDAAVRARMVSIEPAANEDRYWETLQGSWPPTQTNVDPDYTCLVCQQEAASTVCGAWSALNIMCDDAVAGSHQSGFSADACREWCLSQNVAGCCETRTTGFCRFKPGGGSYYSAPHKDTRSTSCKF